MKTTWRISEIIHRFRESFISSCHPSPYSLRVLRDLEQCRTAALGGHVDACPSCGSIKISYNSCRNRHCPQCQGFEREKWIASRKEELLPVKYFHLVFTLPDSINPIGLKYPGKVYGTLFHAAWETVKTFSRALEIQAGMVALLHTWGGELQYHPHLHCLVAAGGTGENGKWKSFPNADNNNPYLFPVKGMSRMFRAKFTELLCRQVCIEPQIRREMFTKDWVVYCQKPFAAGNMVVEYIGRYSYRVAIANSRITDIGEQSSALHARIGANRGKQKTLP